MNTQAVRRSEVTEQGASQTGGRGGNAASIDPALRTQQGAGDPMGPAVVTLRLRAMAADVRSLIEHHVGLVGVLVTERARKVPTHVNRDDLTSAGMMALVLSAGAYKHERGVPFPVFASFRIRGALVDELRAMDWASRSVRGRGREVESIRANLTTTLGRPPRAEDIADALGISTRELDAVFADLARSTVLSLQTFATDSLPATAPSQDECPEKILLHREQLGYLHDAIAALPERLRVVVVAYYFEHRQMSDIAIELSVTQSRVSQLCTEAMTLIRDGMNSQLNPDALAPLAQTGRAAASRTAYYQALADRNTVAGRLDMSTAQGEMCRGLYAEHVETSEQTAHQVRIA